MDQSALDGLKLIGAFCGGHILHRVAADEIVYLRDGRIVLSGQKMNQYQAGYQINGKNRQGIAQEMLVFHKSQGRGGSDNKIPPQRFGGLFADDCVILCFSAGYGLHSGDVQNGRVVAGYNDRFVFA